MAFDLHKGPQLGSVHTKTVLWPDFGADEK